MRFYPLFLGTFFFCCLLVTLPLYYDYVVTKNIFAAACGKPIEDYTCFQDKLDPNGECKTADPEFDRAENEFVRVFIASPPIVKRATCSLDQINVIRWFDEAPGKIRFRDNQLDISWSMLKARNFLFADRILWAQAGYVFKDAFVKYRDRRKLFVYYDQPEQLEDRLSLGVATVLYHEIAHKIEDQFLSGDSTLCEPKNHQTAPALYTSPVRQSHGDLALDMDTDQFNAFTKPYDICDQSEQFAQAFSALLLKEYLGVNYQVDLDTELLLNQDLLLSAQELQPKLKTARAVLSYDVATPQAIERLVSDHQTCSGLFKLN